MNLNKGQWTKCIFNCRLNDVFWKDKRTVSVWPVTKQTIQKVMVALAKIWSENLSQSNSTLWYVTIICINILSCALKMNQLYYREISFLFLIRNNCSVSVTNL